MKSLREIESEIAEICIEMSIPYALTGFSATNHLAPMVRGQKMMVYINGDIDIIAKKLGVKAVDNGANVLIFEPYDEGVLWNTQLIDGIQIASNVQIYLDLKHYRGRGEEAAEFFYKEVIKEIWQQQKSNMTIHK